jgi:hypothetical protein
MMMGMWLMSKHTAQPPQAQYQATSETTASMVATHPQTNCTMTFLFSFRPCTSQAALPDVAHCCAYSSHSSREGCSSMSDWLFTSQHKKSSHRPFTIRPSCPHLSQKVRQPRPCTRTCEATSSAERIRKAGLGSSGSHHVPVPAAGSTPVPEPAPSPVGAVATAAPAACWAGGAAASGCPAPRGPAPAPGQQG